MQNSNEWQLEGRQQCVSLAGSGEESGKDIGKARPERLAGARVGRGGFFLGPQPQELDV